MGAGCVCGTGPAGRGADSGAAAGQYGSRGAKEFVDEVVPALKMEFPQLDLVVEKRSGKPPFLEGFYKNGRRKPIGVSSCIFLFLPYIHVHACMHACIHTYIHIHTSMHT